MRMHWTPDFWEEDLPYCKVPRTTKFKTTRVFDDVDCRDCIKGGVFLYGQDATKLKTLIRA